MTRRLPSLVWSNVYVSEGRNTALLEELTRIAQGSTPTAATLIRSFRDPIYNRSSFSIAGHPEAVAQTALSVSRKALSELDVRLHRATHPRIGVVDHISLHPLTTQETDGACEAGSIIAKAFAEEFGIPVLTYGALNKSGKRLAAVRRSTNYFTASNLQGVIDKEVEADFGPKQVPPRYGMITIGVVPYMNNFNVRLKTGDKAVAAKVTKGVREKDGGLVGIEAVTLLHEGGNYEVACNLLKPAEVGPDAVLRKVQQLCEEYGVEIEDSYTIGLPQDEAVRQAIEKLGLGS